MADCWGRTPGRCRGSCPFLGLGPGDTAWLGLAVALTEQVGWATAAVVRADAPRRVVATTIVVNLLLGLIIVAAKGALQH
ncbi:hypothetical protein GCM10010412_090290 [Nonomuraea recticatena]|uniref:Uncharacterized protein n=1 Tax=Nonomuraea recticatena TaxID=46178 RepID=A0ABP6FR93_9ACTN